MHDSTAAETREKAKQKNNEPALVHKKHTRQTEITLRRSSMEVDFYKTSAVTTNDQLQLTAVTLYTY